MEAKVTWKGRMSFEGTSDSGFKVPLGTKSEVGGDDDGFRPLELFAIGLAGCTGMDVISILKKKKQQINAFEVKVDVDRADTHPKVFTGVSLEYIVTGNGISPNAVDRAVKLSEERYCPAQAMLSKAVEIHSTITIIEG